VKGKKIIFDTGNRSMKKTTITFLCLTVAIGIWLTGCKKNRNPEPEVPVVTPVTPSGVVPTVSTYSVISITDSSAICKANVSSSGSEVLIDAGVCWDTVPHPTLLKNTSSNGTSLGTFELKLNRLKGNKTYYVRGYAANKAGTAYGEELPFTTPQRVATNTEKLTGKNFRMTAATISPPYSNITDMYAVMNECFKDNILYFYSSNAYKEDEGATKCNSGDPQEKNGTWAWNSNETVLTITTAASTISYSVAINDGITLKMTSSQQLPGYDITYTFQKQ
jgi:hypothetical protein